jgi:hypothetical protein
MKTPSSNIQAPEKHQSPNKLARNLMGAWSLKFLRMLELGI